MLNYNSNCFAFLHFLLTFTVSTQKWLHSLLKRDLKATGCCVIILQEWFHIKSSRRYLALKEQRTLWVWVRKKTQSKLKLCEEIKKKKTAVTFHDLPLTWPCDLSCFPDAAQVSPSHHHHYQQVRQKARMRTVFTESQSSQLEALFHRTDYPAAEARAELARSSGLSEETVRVSEEEEQQRHLPSNSPPTLQEIKTKCWTIVSNILDVFYFNIEIKWAGYFLFKTTTDNKSVQMYVDDDVKLIWFQKWPNVFLFEQIPPVLFPVIHSDCVLLKTHRCVAVFQVWFKNRRARRKRQGGGSKVKSPQRSQQQIFNTVL